MHVLDLVKSPVEIERAEGDRAADDPHHAEVHEGGGADVPLRAGFTATIDGGKAKIAPEKSFDDWNVSFLPFDA